MALMPKKEMTSPGASLTDVGAPHTILGPEASFEGKLTFQGQVRIDGKFKGEIVTEDVVVIGKDAEVTATLNVGSLKLHGLLRGNVKAAAGVELYPPARLYGDIETTNLTIQSGVIFEGNCRMENLDRPRPQILSGGQKHEAKSERADDKRADEKKPEEKKG